MQIRCHSFDTHMFFWCFEADFSYRTVGTGGSRGQVPPPSDFGGSDNPILIRGQIMPIQLLLAPTRFSDLPTALSCALKNQGELFFHYFFAFNFFCKKIIPNKEIMCTQSWKRSLIVIVKSPVCKVALFRFHYFFFKESSTFTTDYVNVQWIVEFNFHKN